MYMCTSVTCHCLDCEQAGVVVDVVGDHRVLGVRVDVVC